MIKSVIVKEQEHNPSSWDYILESGFVQVPNVLLRKQSDLGLSPLDLNILLNVLMHWWFPEKMPYPRPELLAKHIGRDPRTVQRQLRSLQNRGFLKRRSAQKNEKGYSVKPYDLSGLLEKLLPLANEELAYRRMRVVENATV